MPIYEYHCRACGHDFEVLQKITDSEIPVCTQCGQAEVDRLVSAAAFQLKGTGWYATDFKNPQTKPTAASASKVAASEGVKTEAKPGTQAAPAGSSEPAAQKKTSVEKEG
ncbi:MAG: zinc ribbon domain-containing protein [Gammaproteobacteria bacterium]|nr:zinc ribbon domain-containing protein [Gammaproteobacteria bacterium]